MTIHEAASTELRLDGVLKKGTCPLSGPPNQRPSKSASLWDRLSARATPRPASEFQPPVGGIRATQKAMIEGNAGLAVLILLFLSSLVYVINGGAFVFEPSPMFEPNNSIATVAIRSGDVGRDPHKE